jgi:hypothetical protein
MAMHTCKPSIPEAEAVGSQFETNLDYIARPSHKKTGRYQWLTPIVLATQEAEIRRIMV